MEYYVFYEIVYKNKETGCYIVELNSFNNDKSKRYYCLQKNVFTEMYKIQSIGTLIEYLDKYGLDLVKIEEQERKEKIFEMLKTYIEEKDTINQIKSYYNYVNIKEKNIDKFNIKNVQPLIDNKIENYKKLTEYDYNLLKEYKNVDKYIFNIKGNDDEKRK